MSRAKSPETPLRKAVRRMAARQLGLANDEVVGFTIRQVARCVQHLLEDGELHKARLTGKNVRYFALAADAEVWLDAAKMKRRAVEIEHIREMRAAACGIDDRVAPWPADAEPFFPQNADGSPAWKFTRCPSPASAPHRTSTHLEH